MAEDGAREWLARFEGVNLAAVLDDAHDLGAARGGGLMLLDAVGAFRAALKDALPEAAVENVSTGASAGLFRIYAPGATDVETKVAETVRDLAGKVENPLLAAALRHGTFSFGVEPLNGDGDFLRAREAALARTRFHQAAAPTLTAPGPSPDPLCDVTPQRPADGDMVWIKGAPKPVSASVRDRRKYGMEAKQGLYRDILDADAFNEILAGTPTPARHPERRFSNDFDDLSRRSGDAPLSGRIAVLYADGNSFSKIQDDFIKKEGKVTPLERQQDFDETLKGHRRRLMERLLRFLVERKAFDPKNRLRLETLLWGGDEFIFALPAWLGWDGLRLVADETAAWPPMDGEPLHHAAGLVFCHRDSPIGRVTALARRLADIAKKVDRDRSLVLWQVLETFDHVGRDVEGHLDATLPGGLNAMRLAVPFGSLDAAEEHIRALKDSKTGIARRALRRYADAAHAEPDRVEDRLGRLRRDASREARDAIDGLAAALSPDDLAQDERTMTALLHLETLWDYVGPELEGGAEP